MAGLRISEGSSLDPMVASTMTCSSCCCWSLVLNTFDQPSTPDCFLISPIISTKLPSVKTLMRSM